MKDAVQGIKYSLQDLFAKAKALGGRCLSVEYRTVVQAVEWECAHLHRFKLRFDHVLIDVAFSDVFAVLWAGASRCFNLSVPSYYPPASLYCAKPSRRPATTKRETYGAKAYH